MVFLTLYAVVPADLRSGKLEAEPVEKEPQDSQVQAYGHLHHPTDHVQLRRTTSADQLSGVAKARRVQQQEHPKN